ncbi:MAG: VCBS repeat-containing protein, partial [Lewinella sp.]|nr:VCBS repeat-containing protein [Lewinella sp.]
GPPATPSLRPPTWFAASDELFGVEHAEQPFDDFAAQPLLPWRLSQWGPGLAVGDANGDGHDDLFVGGAAGSRGVLVLGDRQGEWEFSPDLFPAWNEHTASEDLGCLWLDVDGDGDQDLFVASGGVESPAGDEAYRDRLYLNQGNGEFAYAPQWLPDLRESTAAVAAADFDRDGDLDLFVGGRTQPGAYPRAPQSRLLVNDGTRFIDQTTQAL